jgi:ribosome-binding protein aMBF1 (putative translation factor)
MMTKKLQRVFRASQLTPEEVVADYELREKIKQEFPPKSAINATQADSLSELLRRTIRESGRSLEELASAARLSPLVIAAFMSGERDIHMATADRLARTLGLEVTTE